MPCGRPGALGVSRVISVDPRVTPVVGGQDYGVRLPLAPGEVVLTFDDGPNPSSTNQVLKALADECLRATFFMVGRQARAHPQTVRQVRAAGHTIGTHTQNHPLGRMPFSAGEVRDRCRHRVGHRGARNEPCAVLPFSRALPHARGGTLSARTRHYRLERRRRFQRLEAQRHQRHAQQHGRAPAGAARRHPVDARHQAAHRARAAEAARHAQGARLSHRARRAARHLSGGPDRDVAAPSLAQCRRHGRAGHDDGARRQPPCRREEQFRFDLQPARLQTARSASVFTKHRRQARDPAAGGRP